MENKLPVHGFTVSNQDFPNHMSLVIYMSGCDREPKCNGCHNPQLWERKDWMTLETFRKQIEKHKFLVDSFVLEGGEPLGMNLEYTKKILKILNQYHKPIFMYSWRYIDEVKNQLKEYIRYLTGGCFGPWESDKKTVDGAYPSSYNQQYIPNILSS